ncbi:asparagine synthase-like protein [Trichoderma citrinoviride]|uniref:Asparagine synthase-like protein n=1 Tax=Trichoderma citrinoviride TaxID=58853 RepID=A0A2T4BCF6_9HYPO|nr:asparagine synthase-like protein [Trichoderma citrinoviride]PTB67007.1 asparagine synthase-like protein [Trichoderma citrinoviride]
MCGIHGAVTANGRPHRLSPGLERRLRNRGPDHLGTVEAQLCPDEGSLCVTLTSTVLSLRGDHLAKQPLVDAESGSVLCWNGEAWKLGGKLVEGNDGEAVLSLLAAAASHDAGSEDSVLDALRSIDGPFAFIFLDRKAKRLYYGRDRLGRRSLLLKKGDEFLLSSVAEAPAEGWAEVEADGCYTLQLDATGSPMELVAVRHDWDLNKDLVTDTSDAHIAVLFSGGLDCTVLARMASDMMPPEQAIDLINVAFENPRIAAQNTKLSADELYELCPDRMTGRKSFAELLTVCPSQRWRFVTVNVPYQETCAHRAEVIDLIYPHNTEMDLSIACALYFAARGQGMGQLAPGGETAEPYSTTARVLLSGLGADELFGGYVRHATAFTRSGYPGLIDELKLDVGRLGKRNLGRDDRVMAHWSREVRFPYLDESLVKWAIELPAWEKCDFDNQGIGCDLEPEKRVLRLLAERLGMRSVATEKKRAIQFGARTAKMESGKVKGTTLLGP